MPGRRPCPRLARVPEGLSAAEVGKEIAEHRRHVAGDDASARRGRWISIAEAVLLSVVAVLAAYSGYCAAKWGTEASLSLAKASATRTKANRADLEALQIRTLDSVSFTPAFEAADIARDRVALAAGRPAPAPGLPARVRGLARPAPAHEPERGARPVLPARSTASRRPRRRAGSTPQADDAFLDGRKAGETADKYVRLTVLLATVLFLVGISSHFPRARRALRPDRHGPGPPRRRVRRAREPARAAGVTPGVHRGAPSAAVGPAADADATASHRPRPWRRSARPSRSPPSRRRPISIVTSCRPQRWPCSSTRCVMRPSGPTRRPATCPRRCPSAESTGLARRISRVPFGIRS